MKRSKKREAESGVAEWKMWEKSEICGKMVMGRRSKGGERKSDVWMADVSVASAGGDGELLK